MSHTYLVSYRPIIHNKEGRQAAELFAYPPYIDGSCRREPDFQSTYPSITALCRAGKFAPKLQVGDTIVYITCQGLYPPVSEYHWRLVAILQIAKRFESHESASEWYSDNQLSLPSNCMIAGNEPLLFNQTNKRFPDELAQFLKSDASDEQKIRLWDRAYKKRASDHKAFLACSIELLELDNPAPITKDQLIDIFGKVPGTQNPKRISPDELDQLRTLAHIKSHEHQ